ncbi:MAG: ABC transporter ATP-binding protein, partial [Bacteroidota bacterium]|nr:ABC transporter ATP-binding protein [Bacteroidota bacterium]
MIQIKQLTKSYGDTNVLNIPVMDIPKGQVFGLVGNN